MIGKCFSKRGKCSSYMYELHVGCMYELSNHGATFTVDKVGIQTLYILASKCNYRNSTGT